MLECTEDITLRRSVVDTTERVELRALKNVEIVAERYALEHPVDDAVVNLLSPRELDRADKFAFTADRVRFILRRARLRELLASRMGQSPHRIVYSENEFGKPALAADQSSPSLFFNVSFSENVAVYAFSRELDIGIDVEAVHSFPDLPQTAASCFSSRELAEFRSLRQADRVQGFFNGWTRKEAVVKAFGEGLSYPLGDFDVSLSPGARAEVLRFGSATGASVGWQIENCNFFPGFAGAIACRIPVVAQLSNFNSLSQKYSG